MIKEELMKLLDEWSVIQLENYIVELEVRVRETNELIKEVKQIRRKKQRKQTQDNGHRTGD